MSTGPAAHRIGQPSPLPFHLGTAALEVRTQMGLMAVANARAFQRGEPLPNPV